MEKAVAVKNRSVYRETSKRIKYFLNLVTRTDRSAIYEKDRTGNGTRNRAESKTGK